MRCSTLFFFILFTFWRCTDDYSITGITETDEQGHPIGNVDKNDWCPPQSTPNDDGSITNEDGLYAAYPNPATDGVSLGFQVAGTQRIKLQILNKDKKVVRVLIDEIKPTGHFTIVWDLRDNNGNRVKDGFYRAQFFLNEVLKCHGDIQISS